MIFKYIKYFFDNGVLVDFVLIGVIIKSFSEINLVLRLRCIEVYFELFFLEDIVFIVEDVVRKLNVRLEEGVV